MAYKIKINKRFEIKVAKTYEYLVNEWGFSVADAFYEKIFHRLAILQKQPYIGKVTKKRPKIRRTLSGKYNVLYYRIDGDTIVLINFLNSKKNPKHNPYD